MKGKSIKLSYDRDLGIMIFLWQWKVATTAMLGLKFYQSARSTGIYQRLTRLEKAGFIRARSDVAGQRFAWTLTPKGYSAIKARLPDLKEDGFKSEKLGHDLLTNVVHLGDWIHGIPENYGFFTEQQLRRCDLSTYPDWVPNTDRHRPDGYWKIDSGDKPRVIALEVELSRKPDSWYRDVADFYQAWKRIFKVVWVVNQVKDAMRLPDKLKDRSDMKSDFHNFLAVGQIVNEGWQAKIITGSDAGKSLAELLNYRPMKGQLPVMGKSLMNASKCPYRTEGYKLFSATDFSY